jgi:hypothetical protein
MKQNEELRNGHGDNYLDVSKSKREKLNADMLDVGLDIDTSIVKIPDIGVVLFKIDQENRTVEGLGALSDLQTFLLTEAVKEMRK